MMLIAAALLCGACGPKPRPETKLVVIGWRPSGSWSGQGNIQTESFNIESGQFRIKWETSHESPPGAGMFRVMVHSAVSGRPLSLAIEHQGAGHDTAYVTDDPRPFYLVIESSHLDWSVTADEAVVGEVPASQNTKTH